MTNSQEPAGSSELPFAGSYLEMLSAGHQMGLVLKADQTWTVSYDSGIERSGTFTAKNRQITFTDDHTAVGSCPPDEEPGVYQWALDQGVLTLTVVYDACTSGRFGYIAGHWTRQ